MSSLRNSQRLKNKFTVPRAEHVTNPGIETGKFTTVIAVSGDPLADITELEWVKFVMKGGTVYKNELR